MSRISDMGARSDAMNDVAKALGLEQAPLRIECYDISNTVGGAFRSVHGGVRRRDREKVGVPPFRHPRCGRAGRVG